MDYKDLAKEFTVVIYGQMEKYNEVLSKARCRIFYKYFNRNGTYITEEFANKILGTLPYTPIKGIYNEIVGDYGEHGIENSLGKIYGIIPENANISWEKFKDEDGVERDYVCADVLVFTGIYEEASEILGKSLSMELYKPTLKGEFKVIDNRRAFVLTEGCFVGLQILGDGVEPCFEGAAFYSFRDSLEKTLKLLEENYSLKENSQDNNGGNKNMKKFNYKLSNSQVYSGLFELLNKNYNDEGEWVLEYSICDVYDEYAIAYSYENKCYERIYYTKDNSSDTLEFKKKERCYMVDVTESEKTSLETIQALNNGNYEKVDENLVPKSEFNLKIEEKDREISTLNTDKEGLKADYELKITNLTEELSDFKEYKLNKETKEKEEVLDKYSIKLEKETLDKYKEKLADYTITDLEKDLAFELVNSDPSLFSLNKNHRLIPTGGSNKEGIEGLLDKYETKTEEK